MPDAKQRRATVSGGSPTLERTSLMVEDCVIPSKSQVLNRAHREATLAVLAASENNLQWRVEVGEEGSPNKGDKVWRKTSSESSSGQKGPSESEMEDSVFSSDKEDKDQQCPSQPVVEKKSQEFRVTKPTPVVVELTPDPTPPPKPTVRRTSSSSSISSTTSSSTLISSPCTAPKLKPPDILPKPKLKPPSVEPAPKLDPSVSVRKTSASSKSPSPSNKKSFAPFFSRESKKSSVKSKGGSEKRTTNSVQSDKIKSSEKASESRVSSSSETSWYVGEFVSADKPSERQSVENAALSDLSENSQSKSTDRKTSDSQTDRSSKDSIKKKSDSKGDSNSQTSASPARNSTEPREESKTKASTKKKPACPPKPTKVSIKKKSDTQGGKTSKDSAQKSCESQGERHSKESGVSDKPAEQTQTKDSVVTLLETARGDVQSEDKPQPSIPPGGMQVHHALTMQASVVASDSGSKDIPQLTKVKRLDSPKPSEVANSVAESSSSVKQKKRVEFSSDTKDCNTGEEASHKSSPEKTQISDQSSKESPPVKMRQRSSSRRQGMTDRRVSCKDLGQGDCEGWLLKKREKDRILSKDWTKRWCVLKSHNFYYYKHKEDLRAEGVIYLQAFQVTPAEDLKKTKKFAFKVHNAGTTFYFASERQDDMSKWMNKLGLAAINFESKETVTTGGFFKPGLRSNHLDVPNAYYSESDEDPEEVAAQVENSLRERASDVTSKVITPSPAEVNAKVTESSQPDVGAKVMTSEAEVNARVTITQPEVDIKVTTSSQSETNAMIMTSQPEVNANDTTSPQPEVNAKVMTSSQPEVNAKVMTSQPEINVKVMTSSQPEVNTTKSTQKETVIKVTTSSQGNNGVSSVATLSSSSDSHFLVPGHATQVTASPHSSSVPDNQSDNTPDSSPDNPVACDKTDQGPANASEPMAATGGVEEPEAPTESAAEPQGDDMDTVLRAIHSQDLTIDGVDRRKRRTRHMSSVVGLVEGNNDANVLKLRKLLALKRTLKMKEQDVQDIDRLLASQPTASRLRDFVYHHHDIRL